MNKQYHEMHIRLDETEQSILTKYQNFFEIYSMSKIIRHIIRMGFCIRIDFSADLEVATQIAKIGRNINQIAKASNESHSVSPDQIKTLKDSMDHLENRLEALFKYRGRFTKYAILDGKDNITIDDSIPDEYADPMYSEKKKYFESSNEGGDDSGGN